jgi:hypothetical protein
MKDFHLFILIDVNFDPFTIIFAAKQFISNI